MTDDLITWLRAQLDEHERVAKAAGGDTWRGSDSGIYPEDASMHPGPFAVGSYGYLDDQYVDHITRHDPARVLADVAAKRAILDLMVAQVRLSSEPGAGGWSNWRDIADRTVRLLALPDADRPGYREEWRP